MAGRNENAFCGCTQSSPEAVDFRATDRVSPPLYLRLHVSPGKELVLFIYIRVHVDSAVSRGSGDRNFHKSAPFEHELYEMLEVVWRELEQAHPHGFNFHRCRSFSCNMSFRKGRDLALQV